MVRIVIVMLLLSSSWLLGNLQYLLKTLETQTAFEAVNINFVEDIHSSGSALDDGIDQAVPIGFTFPFNGTNYTEVDIDSNGYLVFGSDPKSVYTNATLPQADKPQSIYPYWDDLNLATGGTLRYGTLGTGDNIHFVVSWENVPQYPSNGSYSLQVILYKDGSIRFRYDATTSVNGSSGTVGIQESTANYDQHSYNSTVTFDATKDILYSYLSAKLTLFKSSCVIADLVNGMVSPKRIPGATIRYAVEINNTGALSADNVLLTDDLSSEFNLNSIENIQVQSGVCDCLGVISTSNNGVNGTGNGINPIIFDFGTIASGTDTSPTSECGYFEVKLN